MHRHLPRIRRARNPPWLSSVLETPASRRHHRVIARAARLCCDRSRVLSRHFSRALLFHTPAPEKTEEPAMSAGPISFSFRSPLRKPSTAAAKRSWPMATSRLTRVRASRQAQKLRSTSARNEEKKPMRKLAEDLVAVSELSPEQARRDTGGCDLRARHRRVSAQARSPRGGSS